ITFIDKNKELIDQLNAEKSYTVHYFGDTKKPIQITGYDAYTTAEEEAVEKLAHSDLITTSVFAGNIKELVGLLRAAAEQCDEKQLRIICCENGVHVNQPLVDENI
ncbi:mannitol dehydrogenase, partial [Erysipelatoclostridium ramosum]|nr:mannitol dehydrogenase [Thomasclavelia ramosa]